MYSLQSSLANDKDVTNDDSNDLWGMEIRYNTTTLGISKLQFNGNIAEMVWGKVLPAGFTVVT